MAETGIEAKLTKHWAIIVKLRADNKCEYCKTTLHLNAHHIVGKRNKSLRWNISNGVCLCPSCHVFSTIFSAHGTPTIFSKWIIGERGEYWHEDLIQEANKIKKWTKQEKKDLLKEFEEMLNV